MKRKIKFLFISILSLIALVGCEPEPSLLAPENLELHERTLSWSNVISATSYKLVINEDKDYTCETNEFVLPDEYFGELSAKVAALKGDLISPYSTTLSTKAYLKLKAPKNITQVDQNSVIWDEVEYASGYVVKVDGVESVVSTNAYTLTSSTAVELSVLASGSQDGYVISSSYSEPIILKSALAAPQNLAYSNYVFTWNSVVNATSYDIKINDSNSFNTHLCEYEISPNLVGEVNFKVKAVSSSGDYFDSLYSELIVNIAAQKLATPQNLVIENNKLSFDVVTLAQTYAIYHNGVFLEEIAQTTYDIPNHVLSESGSFLQVQARSSIHLASDLSAKVYLGALEIQNETDLLNMDSSGFYTLTNNIVLSTPWVPFAFSGILDGQGHKISNIKIEYQANDDYGFFTKLIEATIINLRLEGELEVTSLKHQNSFGSLAGSAKDTTIHNVQIDFDLSVVSLDGIANVGGLFGHFDGGEITSTTYEGSINATHAITGGLVGNLSSNESTSSLIRNSGSEGTINVTGGEQSYVGGLVGYMNNNQASIEASRALMDVVGTSYLGGFVGYMAFGQISNSYARGTLLTLSETLIHAGGFVGRLEGYNNKISSSIAMMIINITQTGQYVFVGSFSGVTPGGSYGGNIYDNCFYDNTLSNFDRIGNTSSGRGDGISGKTSAELLELNSLNDAIWVLTGSHPILLWETI